MTYSVEITFKDETPASPDDPRLANYHVYRTKAGAYNFHHGNSTSPESEVVHLPAHHLKLVEDGVPLHEADLPYHCWNQEWSLRPGGLNIKRTPAQVVAGNFLPPFGDTGNTYGPPAGYVFKPPFDNAGMTKYMPTTGEKPDLGMVPDAAAQYMLGNGPGDMQAWCLAAGSDPYHFRDKSTGYLPHNLITKPANAYDLPGYQPGLYIWKGPRSADGYPGYGDGWGPQKAHWCDGTYLACVAYQDPILLKDLQEAANFCLCSSVDVINPQGIAIMTGEYRAIAHGLGVLFKAHYATLDAEANGWVEPEIHLPSSYFKQLLGVSRDYYMAALSNTTVSRFGVLIANLTTLGPWQHEYLMMDLALGILTGHSDWLPIFLNNLGNVIARTSGKSGWPPAYAAYYFNLIDPATGAPYANWLAIWDSYYASGETGLTAVQYAALKIDPLNGDVILGTAGYFVTTRAVLVFADYLEKKGLAPIRATFPDFDLCMANADRLFHKIGTTNPRVSIVSDPNAVPIALPPPDPISVPAPPLAVLPITVHGLLLRAQKILALIK